MEKVSYDCSNLTINVLSKKINININNMANESEMINGDLYISRTIIAKLKIPKRLLFTSTYNSPDTLMVERGVYPTEKLFDHFQNVAVANEDQIVEHVLKNIPNNLYNNNILNLYKITAYCIQTSTAHILLRLAFGLVQFYQKDIDFNI